MDPCPTCGKKALAFQWHATRVPVFGEVLMYSAVCSECGYRRTDVVELESRQPVRQEVRVDAEEKLGWFVVRSATGRIEIKEIGMELEPGPYSQGFITTVEGVLDRFLSVLSLFGEGEEVRKIREFLERAKKGEQAFTIIIEDERGLSGIRGENV